MLWLMMSCLLASLLNQTKPNRASSPIFQATGISYMNFFCPLTAVQWIVFRDIENTEASKRQLWPTPVLRPTGVCPIGLSSESLEMLLLVIAVPDFWLATAIKKLQIIFVFERFNVIAVIFAWVKSMIDVSTW